MTTTEATPADWTEPGVFEVAPGVHRIPLPLPSDGLRAVNVYAVEDGEGLVLIDSGWSIPVARQLLDAALAALDAGVADIHRFLITHIHRDHYTQAIHIRREVGTPVGLGANERPSIERAAMVERTPMQPQLDQLRASGATELADLIHEQYRTSGERMDPSMWEAPDEWLQPGPITLDGGRRLDAVETPGHTRGHLVFHDEAAGLLFAGDHVLPTITPSIGFEPLLSANPLGDFLDSLAKVRALPDARLLPAHGAVTESVHARVDELVDHHGRRLDQTLAALAQGAVTALDAARILRWTRRGRHFDELDPFNQMLAVGETASHLELLVAQDRVRREIGEDGVYRYQER